MFFSCLTDKHWPNALPDALPVLCHTSRVGEVEQLMTETRQMIAQIINFRKSTTSFSFNLFHIPLITRSSGQYLLVKQEKKHLIQKYCLYNMCWVSLLHETLQVIQYLKKILCRYESQIHL